eukprot:1160940-Pelagomonas_calceolata.AAC.1
MKVGKKESRHPCSLRCLQHCSSYDAQVAEWLWGKVGEGPAPMMTVPMQLGTTLRYGENPHQVCYGAEAPTGFEAEVQTRYGVKQRSSGRS